MRLLFAHQNLGQFGGAETNIQMTAEELASRGHTLDLLYGHRTGRREESWQHSFRNLLCFPKAHRQQWITKRVQELDPDVIYLHNLNDLEATQALLDSGVPVVRMVHDHSLYCLRTYKYNYFTRNICQRPASGHCVFPCLAVLARNNAGSAPVRWLSYRKKVAEIRMNQRCARLVVYSQYQKDELIRNGFNPERIHICAPIRMLASSPQQRTSKTENLILYAGQIIRGKGVDALLRALARVQGEFRCVILGDGNHRRYCERLAQRLGLRSRVEFRGYVPPEESRNLYLEASLFVMSSLWPEPFGMAGPEAMRYGLPVVAFDAGGIREWLVDGENGFLVPWNDLSAFAARVEELLKDQSRAGALGRYAAAWVERYDAVHQLDLLEGIFSSLTREPVAKTETDSMCV